MPRLKRAPQIRQCIADEGFTVIMEETELPYQHAFKYVCKRISSESPGGPAIEYSWPSSQVLPRSMIQYVTEDIPPSFSPILPK